MVEAPEAVIRADRSTEPRSNPRPERANSRLLSEPRYPSPERLKSFSRMQKIAILYDASQAVLSTFDLDEVLRQILVIARDYFHLQNVAILLLDKEKQELYPRCQIGWDAGHEGTRLQLDQGVTGAAARQKRPIYSPNVAQDPQYISSAQSTRSELAIPLMVRDEVAPTSRISNWCD